MRMFLVFIALAIQVEAKPVNLLVINDTSIVAIGGLKQSISSRTLALASVELQLNQYVDFYADGALYRGNNGSDDTGDIQAYSNIDADNFSRLNEAWFEGHFPQQQLRVKAGQMDANSDFAYVVHGSHFIHSSMGVSPSVTYLPTYPAPTLSAAGFWETKTDSEIGFGLFSDQSNRFNEVFFLAQWQHAFGDKRLQLGYWQQTGQANAINNYANKGTQGWYFTIEDRLNITLFDSHHVGWFSQLAYSEEQYNPIKFHLGGGVIFYDVFNKRHHKIGLAGSYAQLSDELFEQPIHEFAIEFFYHHHYRTGVIFKPDIQYIVSPAAELGINDALVFTLRTELTF